MKNFLPSFTKFVAVAACALTLGSCNRAEYAMLPKGSSYHGVARVATPVPAAEVAVAAPAAPVAASTSEITPAPAAVAATTPVAQPVAKAAKPAATTAVAVGNEATAATPAPKLNAFQRLAVNKVTRKVDKMMQKATARQHDNTASTARGGIDGNLRIGLILLLIGLLLGLINGLIGSIVAIIGLVFIVLWLLDMA